MNTLSRPTSNTVVTAETETTIYVILNVSFLEGNSTSFNSFRILLIKSTLDFGNDSIFFMFCNYSKKSLINTEPRGFEPLPTVLETVVLPLTPWLFVGTNYV